LGAVGPEAVALRGETGDLGRYGVQRVGDEVEKNLFLAGDDVEDIKRSEDIEGLEARVESDSIVDGNVLCVVWDWLLVYLLLMLLKIENPFS